MDVLGLPYGGPHNGRDLDGQWFSERTEFFEGEIPSPPVMLMHGTSNGLSSDTVGTVVARWYDDYGGWFKVELDPTHPEYEELIKAHQLGMLKASSGVVPAKYSWNKSDGHINEWLVGELSLIDTRKGYRPSNGYAITKSDVVLTDYYGDEVYEADCSMKQKIQELFDDLKQRLETIFKAEPVTEDPPVDKCDTCDQEAELEAQRLHKSLTEMAEAEAANKPAECLPCRAALQRVEALVKAHKMSPLEGLELIDKFRKDATGADDILNAVEARETTVVAAVAKAHRAGEQLYIAGGQSPEPAQSTVNPEYMNRMRRLAGKPEVN